MNKPKLENGEVIEEFENDESLWIEVENDPSIGDSGFRSELSFDKVKAFITNALNQQREKEITEDTSDGYHTFKELYEFRKLYNAALFNEWSAQHVMNVHKSKRHHDGEECFGGGWFIVMATLPTGQISNHYEMADWDLFDCEERKKAEEWDGHTAQDVAKRLREFLTKLEK